jgi:hypothetical protein
MLKRLALVGLLFCAPSLAAAPDAFQVTGIVQEANADNITVMKGKERFQIARGGDATALNVGDKVTIHYTMTATKIEVKAAAKAPPAK